MVALLTAWWAFASDDNQTPDAGSTTPPATTQSTPQQTTPAQTTTSTTTTTPPTTTTTAPTTTTTTTTAPQMDPGAMVQFVRRYFNDVTNENKRDETWAMLTPRMQQSAGGRQAYDDFWSGIKKVDVGETRADGATGKVIASLTYERDEGDDSQETHEITLVPNGDSFLIDSDAPIG